MDLQPARRVSSAAVKVAPDVVSHQLRWNGSTRIERSSTIKPLPGAKKVFACSQARVDHRMPARILSAIRKPITSDPCGPDSRPQWDSSPGIDRRSGTRQLPGSKKRFPSIRRVTVHVCRKEGANRKSIAPSLSSPSSRRSILENPLNRKIPAQTRHPAVNDRREKSLKGNTHVTRATQPSPDDDDDVRSSILRKGEHRDAAVVKRILVAPSTLQDR